MHWASSKRIPIKQMILMLLSRFHYRTFIFVFLRRLVLRWQGTALTFSIGAPFLAIAEF